MKQLDQYRLDCAQKQKRGLHFILASVVIWCAMTVIYFSGLPIIFGAHLMPFSWLYRSKVYFVLSIIIPFFALIIGLNFDPAILSMSMVGVEIIFCVLLSIENRRLNSWIADYN